MEEVDVLKMGPRLAGSGTITPLALYCCIDDENLRLLGILMRP
jgi:hypothetical protein